jgi:hypothetical protein
MSLPVSSVTPKETVSTASIPNRSFTSEPEVPAVSRLLKNICHLSIHIHKSEIKKGITTQFVHDL